MLSLVVLSAALATGAPLGPAETTLTLSLPDQSGRASTDFGTGALAIYLDPATNVPTRDYLLVVPVQATICEVRSFLGWDRGSIGEAGMDLNARGTRLYERSDHKETMQNYDAWQARSVRFDLVAGDVLHLQTRAWPTAPNAHDGGRSTRVEFSVRLTLSLTGRCE